MKDIDKEYLKMGSKHKQEQTILQEVMEAILHKSLFENLSVAELRYISVPRKEKELFHRVFSSALRIFWKLCAMVLYGLIRKKMYKNMEVYENKTGPEVDR